jgi:hypothetical protein
MSSKRPKSKRRNEYILVVSCLSLASSFGDADALESISSHVPLTPTSAALPKAMALCRKRKRALNNNCIKSIQETTISLHGGEILGGAADEMDSTSFLTNFEDQVSDMRKQLEDETLTKLRRLKEELRAKKKKAEGKEANPNGNARTGGAAKRNTASPNAGQQRDRFDDVEDYADSNSNNNNQDWSDYEEQTFSNHNQYETDSDDNNDMMRQPTGWANEADYQVPKIIVGGGSIGVQPPGAVLRKTPKRNSRNQQHSEMHQPPPLPHGHRHESNLIPMGPAGNQNIASGPIRRGSPPMARQARGNHVLNHSQGSHRSRQSSSHGVIMNPYQQQQQQQHMYPQKAVSDKWRTATVSLSLIVLLILGSMIWSVMMGTG